jgi:predicted GNAT family N-acyltransferase
MLSAAEAAARADGASGVRLHAQVAARSLYERGGYARHGAEFREAGILHVPMEKRFA